MRSIARLGVLICMLAAAGIPPREARGQQAAGVQTRVPAAPGSGATIAAPVALSPLRLAPLSAPLAGGRLLLTPWQPPALLAPQVAAAAPGSPGAAAVPSPEDEARLRVELLRFFHEDDAGFGETRTGLYVSHEQGRLAWLPDDPAGTAVTFNLTLDPSHREILRRQVGDRRFAEIMAAADPEAAAREALDELEAAGRPAADADVDRIPGIPPTEAIPPRLIEAAMRRLEDEGVLAATPTRFLKAQLERHGIRAFRAKVNGFLGTEAGIPMGKYVLAEVITGNVEAWRGGAAGQTMKLLLIAMDELHHYSLLRAVGRVFGPDRVIKSYSSSPRQAPGEPRRADRRAPDHEKGFVRFIPEAPDFLKGTVEYQDLVHDVVGRETWDLSGDAPAVGWEPPAGDGGAAEPGGGDAELIAAMTRSRSEAKRLGTISRWEVNKVLEGEETEVGPETAGRVRSFVDRLIPALRRLPDHAGKVWRGSGFAYELRFDQLPERYRKGGVLTLKSFLSTSKSEAVARSFSAARRNPILWEIEARGGKDVSAFARGAGSTFRGEEEVLLLPGAVIEILNVEVVRTPASRYYHIRAREL